MSSVLTSFVQMEAIDRAALAEKFVVASVSYSELSTDERNTQLPTLPGKIYHSGRVLSLVQDRKESKYWLLLPFSQSIQLKDESLAVRCEPFEQVDGWVLRSLLIRALPRLLEPGYGPGRFEADGLFYVTGDRELSGRGNIITAVRIDPTWSRTARKWYLAVQTHTFTPTKIHERDGRIPPNVAKLPRYELDIVGQELKRARTGEYVRKALSKKHKARVPAVDLTRTTLEAYYSTRLGVLSIFFEDLKRAYGDAVSIELEAITPEEHRLVRDAEVSAGYESLHRTLRENPIWIINASSDEDAAARLETEIKRLGFDVKIADDISPNELNILLVDEKDSYESKDVDPYQIARKTYQDAVIQSCYPERLRKEGKSHVAEVLVKELLIKWEVKRRELMVEYPALPEDAWFIMSMRPKHENLRPKARWPMYFCQKRGKQLEFGALTDEMFESLQVDLNSEIKRQVFEGYDRADLIYWPDSGHAIVAGDTGAVSLPDEKRIHQWVAEIDRTLSQGIPASLLEQYCLRHPDSPITSRLRTIMAGCESVIEAESLKDIGYKRKSDQHFHDFLSENGARLKAPFASWDAGALQATTGIWINRLTGFYMAGPKGSPSRKQGNFCHVYRVNAGDESVPDWFWDSLKVWHVRHKGPTVLPYIFKHLKEYAARQTFADSEPMSVVRAR
ncbi:hypothetical protein [Mangrovitalea sediminis]|uniref:hypothetical protein n=1 Tax=Mangrovitalea sediminis TaxID=1982043 RepID=UPI000BE5556B|nr:hypothetical protein [Mangrovitalea sediminis]